MKVIRYDQGPEYGAIIESQCDRAMAADGKNVPYQGCFGCWNEHPAECFIKDRLRQELPSYRPGSLFGGWLAKKNKEADL